MRGGGRVPDRAARRGILSAPDLRSRAIFPCESGRDEVSEQALAATFDKGGAERVTRLYRCDDLREDQCWLRAGLVCVGHDRGQRADCRRRVALAPGDESGALDLNKLVIEPGRQI